METGDAWSVLQKILNRLQENAKARRVLAITAVAALLGVTSFFAYGLLPKRYTLSVSGGGILTSRHHLARVLQNEAMKSGLTLEIKPIAGSMDTLRAVNAGELDLALVQGGLERKLPNVSHVATLPPEVVHVIVRPEIAAIEDLKGRVINTGAPGGGTRTVARTILRFFELEANVDYVEKNHTDEELFNMQSKGLPDAVFSISYIPSYIADYFVRQHGYRLLEIPYSDSLGLWHVWVRECRILQCTYDTSPPIPEEEIGAVGVDLEIIANSHVDPLAISRFLEVLYGSSIENTIRQSVTEETGDSFSQYPLSAGTLVYIHRNEPLFSMEKVDSVKNLFGSVMAGLSTLMVAVKWFRGSRREEEESTSSSA